MARHVPSFDKLVQRSKKPRSRVARGMLAANLEVIVQHIDGLTQSVRELLAVNEKALVTYRKAEAEAQRKAEESAKRAAEREAAERKARLAEAAKAQAAAAIEEAEAAEAEAKAAASKTKAPKKK